ncbi:MAG: S8/S53 family peptidase, partial [Ilumatobacteraceae bacterium]
MSRRPIGTNGKVLRIIARPPAALTPRRAGVLVRESLARTSWGKQATHRTTHFDDDAEGPAAFDLLIEVAVPDAIGSARYAKRAHDLVQRLYDTGAFVRVEADIPIAAFEPSPPPIGPAPRSGRRGVARSAPSTDCSAMAGAASPDWALRAMRVPEALALIPPARAAGKGIRIGHPDSGYSDHFALGLGQLDRQQDRDVISGDDEALDPLKPPKKSFFNPLPNPGHGTSTASVIVGQGTDTGFHGVATAATLVPIRATESVVQVFDSDVAKAVRWARTHGCLVVSMSLGGKGFFGLQDAIGEAVAAGMIVLAAAGNQVGFVTAPASYDNCIAVAASGADGKPWAGSSHG